MPRKTLASFLLLAILTLPAARAEVVSESATGFVLTQEVTVPGSPTEAFDLFTGDVLPWWDHHVSESPKALYIEPKPGGGFYEIFDEEGNGALHATVTVAERGKLLRLSGPMGLSGYAIEMVQTLEFEAVEGGTRIALSLRAMGQVEEGWPAVVDKVWHHFLVERFKPYAEERLGSVEATGEPGS